MAAKVTRLPTNGATVTMGHGRETEFQEDRFCAVVSVDGREIARVGNSSLLCLPEGSVRAPFATDEQILRAVLNDEPVM